MVISPIHRDCQSKLNFLIILRRKIWSLLDTYDEFKSILSKKIHCVWTLDLSTINGWTWFAFLDICPSPAHKQLKFRRHSDCFQTTRGRLCLRIWLCTFRQLCIFWFRCWNTTRSELAGNHSIEGWFRRHDDRQATLPRKKSLEFSIDWWYKVWTLRELGRKVTTFVFQNTKRGSSAA